MAGRGPAPKGTRSRERDQRRRTDEMTVISSDGKFHGPALPAHINWPDVTLAWWDTWRKSPQSRTFTETDWAFLLDTALLHMEFWDGDRTLAGELRLRAAKFGATPEDRARLKIQVGSPDAKDKPRRERTPAARTRRERVLRAVGDD